MGNVGALYLSTLYYNLCDGEMLNTIKRKAQQQNLCVLCVLCGENSRYSATIGYPVPLPPPDGYAALLSDGEWNAEEDSACRRGFSRQHAIQNLNNDIPHYIKQYI